MAPSVDHESSATAVVATPLAPPAQRISSKLLWGAPTIDPTTTREDTPAPDTFFLRSDTERFPARVLDAYALAELFFQPSAILIGLKSVSGVEEYSTCQAVVNKP